MSDSSSDPVASNEQEEIQTDRSSTPIPIDADDDHVRAAELLASMKNTPEIQYSYTDDDYQREPFEWDFDDEEEEEEGEIKEKPECSSDDSQKSESWF